MIRHLLIWCLKGLFSMIISESFDALVTPTLFLLIGLNCPISPDLVISLDMEHFIKNLYAMNVYPKESLSPIMLLSMSTISSMQEYKNPTIAIEVNSWLKNQ